MGERENTVRAFTHGAGDRLRNTNTLRHTHLRILSSNTASPLHFVFSCPQSCVENVVESVSQQQHAHTAQMVRGKEMSSVRESWTGNGFFSGDDSPPSPKVSLPSFSSLLCPPPCRRRPSWCRRAASYPAACSLSSSPCVWAYRPVGKKVAAAAAVQISSVPLISLLMENDKYKVASHLAADGIWHRVELDLKIFDTAKCASHRSPRSRSAHQSVG